MKIRLATALLFVLAVLPQAGFAVQPSEMLADPKLEARARVISEDLRCLVCQNQSIDDSDADLAHDLRVLVRQRLQVGDSDAQVKQYLVDRYGDYVLLTPPFKASTYALWMGPPFFMITGGILGWLVYRRRQEAGNAAQIPLSPEEKMRITALIDSQQTGREKTP